MRKNLNRLATLALSGMMVMSMAMPAFAENATLKFTKVLHMDGYTYAPNTTFEFEVKKVPGATFQIGQENHVNEAGADNAVSVTPVTYVPGDGRGTLERDAQNKITGATLSKDTNIVVDKSAYTKNGYYFYTLTEKAGLLNPATNLVEPYEGIRYSKAEYYVVVIVTNKTATNAGDYKVVVQRKDQLENKLQKVDSIQNNYGKHFPPDTPDFPDPTPGHDPKNPDPKNPDPKNDTTHDVTIKKRLAGDMVDESKEFKFSVKVESQKNAGERYVVEILDKTGAVISEDSVNDGVAKSFTVSKDTGIRIYGLTKNDLVKVHEENGDTYKMTVAAVDNTNDSFIKNLTTAQADYNTQFNVYKDEAKVDVTNTKASVTPTGIVMNVAPYAMMLAVAGGLGVVFMNRKKEEE